MGVATKIYKQNDTRDIQNQPHQGTVNVGAGGASGGTNLSERGQKAGGRRPLHASVQDYWNGKKEGISMTQDVKRAIALDIVNTARIINPERHITLSFSTYTTQVVLYYEVDDDTREDDLKWLNDSYGFNGEAILEDYMADEGREFGTIEINL